MSKWFSNYLRLLVLMLLPFGCSSQPSNDLWLIINARIVDTDKKDLMPEDALVVENGLIKQLAQTAKALKTYRNKIDASKIIDAKEGYLIPGLFDLHIHNRGENEMVLKQFLCAGITTVRNMNGADAGKDHLAIAAQIEEGQLWGPRYFTATPYIEQMINEGPGIKSLLSDYQSQGYQGVKIHDNMPRETYHNLLSACEALGFPIYGHAQRDKTLSESLKLQEIVHAEEFLYITDTSRWHEQAYLDSLVGVVKKSGVTVTPTLGIYGIIRRYFDEAFMNSPARFPFFEYVDPEQRRRFLEQNYYLQSISNPQIFDYIHQMYGLRLNTQEEVKAFAGAQFEKNYRRLQLLVAKMAQAGVPLLAGSDSFGLLPQGFGLHLELQELQKAGLSPGEVLKAATLNAAQFMKLPKLGAIREGNTADFVILENNPLDDISATLSFRGLYHRRKYYDEHFLRGQLKEIKTLFNR